MARFRSHIGTEDHKRKLQKLVNNRKLGKNTMDYSVEFNELKDLCAQREQERKGTNGQEPFVDSLPPVSLLAEMFKSQTSENDLEIIENVRPNTDVSRDLSPEMNKISRKRKVNTLISLSLKEEELTSSLENVGEQLFQAYSTLQSAYSEVQRLLAVKQEVTSEMASLRAKRIEILQDMKNPDDQQEVLNGS
ncbi:zinc finger protein 106 [Labeo rohita]|uniref:Zinc finger protein 106 n=1 Tax=Labeo rohita TaxID=84645 RepID=A0A498NC94_LABRO|nr:zinc finger protein 106 [Labeo rohita]